MFNNIHIDFGINCNINLKELNNFLNSINWNKINNNDILYYSSNSSTDFIDLKVMSIDNKEVYLKSIFS